MITRQSVSMNRGGKFLACEQAPSEGGKKFGERSVNPAAKRVGVGA